MRKVHLTAGMAVLIGALVLGAPFGCAGPDKLVYENFTQLRPYVSSESDVTTILGEPTNVLGNEWLYQRPDQHLVVIVEFDDRGRLARKQWIDGRTSRWEDSREVQENRLGDPSRLAAACDPSGTGLWLRYGLFSGR